VKKTLAIAVLVLVPGCEDWKLDLVGDHQPDERSSSWSPPSTSSDEREETPQPAVMLPSTSDAGTNDEDSGFARTTQCVGAPSVCEYQITQTACEWFAGCVWIPK
jgi:hypothetical protein